MAQTGHAGPPNHSGCSPGHSDLFGGSHTMITQNFEKSQKSVVGPARDLLSDLRALQNQRHFGSTMFRAVLAKQRFLQNKYNSIS